MVCLCLINIAMQKTCDVSWWKLIQINPLRFHKDLLVFFKNTWRNSRILNFFSTSYMSNWKPVFSRGKAAISGKSGSFFSLCCCCCWWWWWWWILLFILFFPSRVAKPIYHQKLKKVLPTLSKAWQHEALVQECWNFKI